MEITILFIMQYLRIIGIPATDNACGECSVLPI